MNESNEEGIIVYEEGIIWRYYWVIDPMKVACFSEGVM